MFDYWKFPLRITCGSGLSDIENELINDIN